MDWEDIYVNGKRRAYDMLNQLCESAEDEILKMDIDPDRFFRERNQFDAEKAFEKLIGSKPKRQVPKLVIVVAACCILLLGATLGYLFYSSGVPLSQGRAETSYTIEMKAGLTLISGQKILLSGGEERRIEQGNTCVMSDSLGLCYKLTGLSCPVENPYNLLEVPRGGKYRVTLCDSSEVWLNADSWLKYPVDFTSELRIVELSGEAYFEVKADKQRPFIVKTASGEYRVYGTSFNIREYFDEPGIITTLLEGSIGYWQSGKEEIVLKPGQQLSLSKNDSIVRIDYVDVKNFVCWKEGYLYFDHETLNEIMGGVGRLYGVDVIFKTADLRNIRYSGTLNIKYPLDSLLKKFEDGTSVHCTVNKQLVTIESK